MTFLRWAGSKKQLLEVLANCWHAAIAGHAVSRYVEAFSGSAALFFRLNPDKALLVDINQSLQDCMMAVRDNPYQVAAILRGYSCTEQEYYEVRSTDASCLSPSARAARFIYLNRNCFNGLYRTNVKGQFNVPYGKSPKSGALPQENSLFSASKKLEKANLLSGDFYSLLAPEIRQGDFIYLDPPYAKENSSLDNQYGPTVFGTQDLKRLEELVRMADIRGAKFVISYAACNEIEFIATQWVHHEVTVQRTIAANAKHRTAAKEILITNI